MRRTAAGRPPCSPVQRASWRTAKPEFPVSSNRLRTHPSAQTQRQLLRLEGGIGILLGRLALVVAVRYPGRGGREMTKRDITYNSANVIGVGLFGRIIGHQLTVIRTRALGQFWPWFWARAGKPVKRGTRSLATAQGGTRSAPDRRYTTETGRRVGVKDTLCGCLNHKTLSIFTEFYGYRHLRDRVAHMLDAGSGGGLATTKHGANWCRNPGGWGDGISPGLAEAGGQNHGSDACQRRAGWYYERL